MSRKTMRERPFEYLRRQQTGEPFSQETIKNWYVARSFVLERLKQISFAPGSNQHLNVVLDGDSPLMLAVLRHVALYSHYPNFIEYDALGHLACLNRTCITLISNRDADAIVADLKSEECLCNLLDYCKLTVYGVVQNADSYLDIEVEIAHQTAEGNECVHLSETDVKSFLESQSDESVYTIDTRKAVYASKVYMLGAVIDNVPYEDINGAGRYTQALDTFQYRVLRDTKGMQLASPSEWSTRPMASRNGLSNIFCSDCFASRELAIKSLCPNYDKLGVKERLDLWEEYNNQLSLSEHNRWTVEKLIMGFKPLSCRQRTEYESLFETKRVAYGKLLKNNAASAAHIDICSYRDLRRIDPNSLKYDSFLMLAIPHILGKVRKESGE